MSDKTGKKSFCHMKIILAVDVLMVYPIHNIPFHIYIDASNYHMDAVIIQQK